MQDFDKKIALTLSMLLLMLLAGCSARVSTEDIRSELSLGHYDELEEKMQTAHEVHEEFVTALNLARLYQLQGRWRESISLYDSALRVLEEYEQRAIVNIREMLGAAGSILVSRGSRGYFGTGYERTLLHTFNSLNYLMLQDFTGAMVEMRKMEQRQERWLAEEGARLQEHLEEAQEEQYVGYDELGSLPENYTMTGILNDPRTRDLANSYQDAFSYGLSAIICRIANDPEYAAISLRRAAMLSADAYSIFSAAWGKGKMTAGLWEPVIPPLPSANPPAVNSRLRGSSNDGRQEVSILVFCGLAPALHMERVRVPAPYIGYLMLDLPAFAPPVKIEKPIAESANDRPLNLYALLHTDLLAYSTLRDELRYEIGSAVARAVSRAVVAGSAYALAAVNKDTRSAAALLGFVTTGIMDLLSFETSQNVRNWELLPSVGYLSQGYVQKGSGVRIKTGREEARINLPPEANGVIIMVSHVAKERMRVDYVAY
jgi:hypothetical protein